MLLTRRALVLEEVGDERAVYLPNLLDAERDTAKLLLALRDSILPAPQSEEAILAEIAEYERDE